MTGTQPRPRGFLAIAIFLWFGALMAALAGITLIRPGTPLSFAWRLNPRAYAQMAPLGSTIGVPFLGLAMFMAAAAYLWLKKSFWGWLLALIIFALQLAGDIGNLMGGEYLQGCIGIVIAGGLVFYLTRPQVRSAFQRKRLRDAAG